MHLLFYVSNESKSRSVFYLVVTVVSTSAPPHLTPDTAP